MHKLKIQWVSFFNESLIVAGSFEKMEGDSGHGGCAGGTRPLWGWAVRLRHSRYDQEYVRRRGCLACPRFLPRSRIVRAGLGMGYARVQGADDDRDRRSGLHRLHHTLPCRARYPIDSVRGKAADIDDVERSPVHIKINQNSLHHRRCEYDETDDY